MLPMLSRLTPAAIPPGVSFSRATVFCQARLPALVTLATNITLLVMGLPSTVISTSAPPVTTISSLKSTASPSIKESLLSPIRSFCQVIVVASVFSLATNAIFCSTPAMSPPMMMFSLLSRPIARRL